MACTACLASPRLDALAASLERSPELFPHSLNTRADSVSLIRLTERDYEAASFLDARILTRQTIGRTIPWPQLEAALSQTRLEEDCDFIFHIGHVGSTLLSRLLGKHPALFALREPAILRTLTQIRFDPAHPSLSWGQDGFEARLSDFLKLWSRPFRPEQHTCIKATSFVSELAGELLARPFRPRAIFVFVPAESYLAAILGGPNSRQESKMLAQSRLQRLERRLGGQPRKLATLSEGEMIAMSWACEITALSAAAAEAGDRVLWLNFDGFLEKPQATLRSALTHFRIEAGDQEIEKILSGPEMHRYSKGPEHAYDANLRHDVLNHARMEFGNEIASGLSWLESASEQFRAIRAAMEMSLQV